MQEFFTWNALLTCSGATLATTMLTQFLKELGFIKKIPTRIFSYVVAVVLMLLAMLFEDAFSLENVAIALINATVVALASNGAFDAVNS
ncbi:MAG: hypothetical protein J1E60_02190 [Christensenellaceae bacterium]|nr:hypothetical protein [Christensenellaceae bacterium]